MCKCGHEFVDHLPEPSAGCVACTHRKPREEQCQCYEDAELPREEVWVKPDKKGLEKT